MNFGRPKTQPGPVSPPANLLASCLLVVDGSDPCIAAANFAVELATQTGSRITAVYVVDTATMDFLMQLRVFVREEREEFEADIERTGRRYLEYVSTIGQKHGVAVSPVLRKGRFHTAILQEARDLRVNAIIMGGWRRSITRKDATAVERQLILDLADCPVIVVKSEAERGKGEAD
jgi:nucleotide-binding universal stress UspA family protein